MGQASPCGPPLGLGLMGLAGRRRKEERDKREGATLQVRAKHVWVGGQVSWMDVYGWTGVPGYVWGKQVWLEMCP